MLTLDAKDGPKLAFLAEGAANIVYRLLPPEDGPDAYAEADLGHDEDEYPPTEIQAPLMDPTFTAKLLRLRKDLPSSVSVADSYQQYLEYIVPLFSPETLVHQELIEITSTMVQSCNRDLKYMEAQGVRPKKRAGIYLAQEEEHGRLITDMSCSSIEDEAHQSLEFKPKWLAQSPSAPADARRCRTCALRAMHDYDSNMVDHKLHAKGPVFCPLALMSEHRPRIREVVEAQLWQHSPVENFDELTQSVTEYLFQNPLLERLRNLQTTLDTRGIFEADPSSSEFRLAMTLRDCTLFLKVATHIEIWEFSELSICLGTYFWQRPNRSSSCGSRSKVIRRRQG